MKPNKKNISAYLLFSILVLSFAVLQTGIISAAPSTVCAEHTTYGAWCQDVPSSLADPNYRVSQTSCQSTTYCATGTCVNTQAGTCLASPQATCNSAQGGIWYNTAPSSTPVCQLGCCFIGEDTSFTTQATCKSFATLYGVNTTFSRNINDEATCIASAHPLAKGACVYNTDNGRSCKFTTRQNCNSISGGQFHQDFLCTNPNLGTNCAMTKQTTCLGTADQVYFIDSCGNQANVYDANRVTDVNYWSYVTGTNNVLSDTGDNKGNIESPTNGYCSYLNGSTCMAYNANSDKNSPQYGNNICRSVNCDSLSDQWIGLFNQQYGRTPVNGESWCGTETATSVQLEPNGNPGISSTDLASYSKTSNIPGSTEVLFTCSNGKITTTIDGTYRWKICNQSMTSNGYYVASFVGNQWADCTAQNNSNDCLDATKRNCQWLGSSVGGLLTNDGICVPKYPTAFDTSSSATSICGAASITCPVNYSQTPLEAATNYWKVDGSKTCLDNYKDNNGGKPSILSDWQTSASNLCSSLGDCGISNNYIGTPGVNTAGPGTPGALFSIVMGNETG